MVPPSDYLATILDAGIITLKSGIPAAGILVHRPYNPGCRDYNVRKSDPGCRDSCSETLPYRVPGCYPRRIVMSCVGLCSAQPDMGLQYCHPSLAYALSLCFELSPKRYY